MESFDFRNIKIENKKYLIEASAGTGKTHSMSQIFIRLILEGVLADKILLVTFTNAAADEIKERILAFLMEVKAYLSNNKKIKIEKIINDSILKEYLDNIIKNKLKEDAIKNIENSIFSFDIISACTIHSFAMKLVKEFSNELGLGLDFEFSKNTEKVDHIILQKYLYSTFNRIKPFLKRDFKSNKDKNDKIVVLKDLISNLKNLQKFYDNHKPPIDNELIERFQSENQNENSIQKYLDSIYIIEDLIEDFLSFYHIESSNLKKNYRVFNFNDSIELLLDFFSKNEDAKKRISNRFDIIIIDDFQDTDERQVKLFDILFSKKSVFYI
ncbi:MAG: UvrD-helicase domain-containing protein, partial [Exilispira sp.]